MAEERRLVTVLFADVVGSTSLGEELDPEDVRALLTRLFSIATDAVEQHGGRVEKFIGDAIMAVFGLPTAHDDDPARALSAAIDLRDRVRADPALGERMPIRLGVNGGDVIATRESDAQQFLITGDAVNTAARLQQSADAWSIVVGERTVRAAADRFDFGPLVEIEAKGKAQPIRARELQGLAAVGARRSVGRMVGRDADIDQLELVARRAFDERRPFLVNVVAPAGVGKSRLLEEFLGRLDAPVRVAMAQCLPYGQRLTYWPMRAILLSIVGLGDDATPELVRRATAGWLREAAEPDADRLAELLSATIGAAEVEGGDRNAVFAAWRRFVELAAELSPTVLVIEDLHWSSDSLLDLIEAMLQPRSDVPLLMVALARPELLDRRPSWGGGRRSAVSISLEPLPSAAVAALVADLLESPSSAIVDAVVQRAEGNPFYAGEIVRSLIVRLGARPDPAVVAAAIDALPDTVHATVLARLDALEAGARRVVQLGAVLGRTFEPRAMPTLDESLTPVSVDAAIDMLIERDLVRPAGRGALTFRHILIREVAYGTLPRAERARLHGAAGTWLEAEATHTGREDELAELVAFHLREAVTLGSLIGEATTDELAGRAVAWLRRAGEAAAAGAASVEAARHLNAAIELAPREAQPDLLERLGQIWVGGDQAAEAFEQAYNLGRELGLGDDQALRTMGQALIVRTRWSGSVGRQLQQEAVDHRYAEVKQLLARDVSALARLYGELAVAFRPMSTYSRVTADEAAAAQAATEAIALARQLDDADLISAAFDAAAVVPQAADMPEFALAYTRERLELADRLSTSERTDAWIMVSWMEVLRGNLTEAALAADRARIGLISGQASAWVLGATAWRIVALHALGRWDEALVEADRAERSWQESELRAPWYSLSGFLAAYSIARGRGDAVGAEHWRDLVRQMHDRSDPGIRTTRLRAYVEDDLDGLVRDVIADFRTFTGRFDYVSLALALLADRRHPIAVSDLDAILAHAEPGGHRLLVALAYRARGLARGDAGDLERALAACTDMSALAYVARVRTELGLMRGDRTMLGLGLDELEALGDVEQAARVATEARTMGTTRATGNLA